MVYVHGLRAERCKPSALFKKVISSVQASRSATSHYQGCLMMLQEPLVSFNICALSQVSQREHRFVLPSFPGSSGRGERAQNMGGSVLKMHCSHLTLCCLSVAFPFIVVLDACDR